MKRFTFLLFVLLLGGLSSSIAVIEEDWKLAKDSDGIKVYTKKIEGIDFKSFKAITTFDASPDKIMTTIKDFSNYKKWVADIEKTEVLKKINDNQYITYGIVDTPWPISDRDVITEYHFSKKSNGEILVTMEGKENHIPVKDDYIRILDSKGSWTLTPTGDGKTKITYQFVANPNGSLPTWVVNMFIVDGPYKTLKALKEIVE